MAQRSFSEQLQKGLADAVADIREKVVEEPMWGRSLGDNEPFPWPQSDGKSFGSSERTIEREPEIDMER
ncbi:hypothetical protein [Granulicella aggregans]|uniref:hypothetical protein n=1 Tax=Granulicella aggregans TaxID=474949 RepID=UPI0021DFC19E|nr:hypothetical protein [Granulicella aggregans]